MDTHPELRIQFFLRGPFDPIETLSLTVLGPDGRDETSIVMGGEHPQYELWTLIAEMAASSYAQLRMDLEPAEE